MDSSAIGILVFALIGLLLFAIILKVIFAVDKRLIYDRTIIRLLTKIAEKENSKEDIERIIKPISKDLERV